MTITAMREKHLDAVVAIEAEVFSDPWSRAMFFQDMQADCAHCYVAVEDDVVIGYVDAWFVCDECTVNRIAFSKKKQRLGNGSTLLSYVMQEAACRGMKTFFLEVRASNMAALRFYEKAGFIKAGLRKAYYSDTREDAVLMSMTVFS
ncbi:MAG: ribosomal protein S18-alanine N-acetyltransferase [Deltaproteobacteria bacterium]|nr:ribosomal protein S18-alanine N-acetyltransferase [Deltaproteobacteria bacterium]